MARRLFMEGLKGTRTFHGYNTRELGTYFTVGTSVLDGRLFVVEQMLFPFVQRRIKDRRSGRYKPSQTRAS